MSKKLLDRHSVYVTTDRQTQLVPQASISAQCDSFFALSGKHSADANCSFITRCLQNVTAFPYFVFRPIASHFSGSLSGHFKKTHPTARRYSTCLIRGLTPPRWFQSHNHLFISQRSYDLTTRVYALTALAHSVIQISVNRLVKYTLQ